jgi:hypothetical protein
MAKNPFKTSDRIKKLISKKAKSENIDGDKYTRKRARPWESFLKYSIKGLENLHGGDSYRNFLKVIKLFAAISLSVIGLLVLLAVVFQYKISGLLLSADKILIALTLLIIGQKAFSLFMDESDEKLEELDLSVISMAIITLSIVFLSKAVEKEGYSSEEVLQYGIGFGGVIAGLSLYVYLKSKTK